MASATNYTVNNFLIDRLFRGTSSPAIPTTMYFCLFVASKGYWTASTAYSLGDTLLPATPNGHIYKCTTAGTSGASAPTWNTGSGSTTTDGTAVWTEQTTAILGGTLPPEASYTGYARVALASSQTNWNATQNGTGVSNGTSGQTSNIGTITFGAPTSNQTGVVAGMFLADAASAGNPLYWAMLTNPKTINNGDAAPNFPAGAFTYTQS